MRDKLDINLRIGDVALSLNIHPEEEELLRAVAKEVNHAYDVYKKRFKDSPEKEVLAMVILLFARGYTTLRMQTKELDEMLDEFNTNLDALLK